MISETDELTNMMLDGWKSILRKQVTEEEVEMFLAKYESEDTPRTLSYQLDLMKQVGFSETIILHKHFNFATFGAKKMKDTKRI